MQKYSKILIIYHIDKKITIHFQADELKGVVPYENNHDQQTVWKRWKIYCSFAFSELANWFGKDFSKLQIAFTSNLGTNAGVMAANGLGYPISIEGAAKYWREDILVQRRISPEITTSTVIAWRRNIPYSLAVRKMIEEINAFQA